jgi:superfamily II DNA/RNA helicase
VLILQLLGINAVAVTKDNISSDKSLWGKVRDGYFRLVFASPETLLAAEGYFMTEIAGRNTGFEKHLVAIAVDECHLIWDWEHFRKQYKHIEKLRMAFPEAPIACLSATVSAPCAAYVHEACGLNRGTIRYSLPLRRDNIDIVVSSVAPSDERPLHRLIPTSTDVATVLEIPKTLVFFDNIDAGIELCRCLRARLSRQCGTEIPETLVDCYYGSLDAAKKTQILENLLSGKTRILICTDAFGMGIDIPDIEVVVQWHLTPRCTMSSLSQRIGRAARGRNVNGAAAIYVSTSFFKALPRDWRVQVRRWDEPDMDSLELDLPADEFDVYDFRDSPPSTTIPLRRLGLPVTPATRRETSDLISKLYQHVKSLREELRKAHEQSPGDRWKASRLAKLDPPLRWFLLTTGCRHRVLGAFFRDPANFIGVHQGWCCDSCAAASPQGLGNHVTAGIRSDISVLNELASSAKQNPSRRTNVGECIRNETITARHVVMIKNHLRACREVFASTHTMPWIVPGTIIPDRVIDAVAENLKRITSAAQLVNELGKAGLVQKHSFVTLAQVDIIYKLIEYIVCRPPTLQPILPKSVPELQRAVAQRPAQQPAPPPIPSLSPPSPTGSPANRSQDLENVDPHRLAVASKSAKATNAKPLQDAEATGTSAKRKPLGDLNPQFMSKRGRAIILPERYQK